jgi:heme/copper-type cytochrome/quinol oxidase subunit 4
MLGTFNLAAEEQSARRIHAVHKQHRLELGRNCVHDKTSVLDPGNTRVRLSRPHGYVTIQRQSHDDILTSSIAEETQNASTSTPKAIMIGFASSVILGFFPVFTLIFTWGNALDVESNVPFIHLIHLATGNRAATTALALMIVIPLSGSVVACTATASRQIWAMARDHGIPLSGFFSRVSYVGRRYGSRH